MLGVCVLHILRAVTLVVYLFFVCVSRFLWCETGNTLVGLVCIRQGVSSWLVLSCHLKMWLVWEDRLHVEGMCAIRACACEGEATGRGALRWEGAFKGSGRGLGASFRVGVVSWPRGRGKSCSEWLR